MTRPTDTPEEDARIVELYVEHGHGIFPVAGMVGRSPDFVRKRLIANGVPRRKPGEYESWLTLDYELLEKTAKLYARGFSSPQIARAMGCAETTVRYRLKRFGVERRTLSEAQMIRGQRRFKVDAEEVVRMYVEDKMSIREIARTRGVTRWAIKQQLRRRGVRFRSLSEAGRLAYNRGR